MVERYARLVRLAHLVLPPALGRHRRVLLAHGVVQRTLPGLTTGRGQVPVPDGSTDPVGYAWVRGRVLSAALAFEHRPRLWPRRLPPPRALRPGLPAVWGLRFFPGRAVPRNWRWTGYWRRSRRRSGPPSRWRLWRSWVRRTWPRCWRRPG
ncbi:hypothetical protein OIM90_29630 [Streptomyces sp. AD16]|nr:hypothetical protein OIM90_29630 [Streptomyces sp. AD16]